jgi:hypothetical protein
MLPLPKITPISKMAVIDNLHYGYILEIIKSANLTTACNWFSYFYSFTLLYLLATTIMFVTGYHAAQKKTWYIIYFWVSAVALSILTTVLFRNVCQEELPRRSVLAYFR